MAQTSQTEARITLSEFRKLAGISTATAHRWLASGVLGTPHGKHPVRIDLAAVETAIGIVSAERLAHIRQARAPRKRRGCHG